MTVVMADTDILRVSNLTKYYPMQKSYFSKSSGFVKAVDGVDFTVRNGEIFGVVGESGCGKTTMARMLIRAFEPTSGEILFRSRQGIVDMAALSEKELKPVRKDMQMIFQDPYASLNPRMPVRDIVAEPLAAQGVKRGKVKERVAELLELVGLNPDYMVRYPHAFSGGQRQRIGIARALALNPSVIIADECVSALDVSVQAQILNLLLDLQKNMNITIIFIAHDLAVVRYICDRVAVMYMGKIVEMASADKLFGNPSHPYTKALLGAVPDADPNQDWMKDFQVAEISEAGTVTQGCSFAPRCPYADDFCRQEAPLLREIGSDAGDIHSASCHKVEAASLKE